MNHPIKRIHLPIVTVVLLGLLVTAHNLHADEFPTDGDTCSDTCPDLIVSKTVKIGDKYILCTAEKGTGANIVRDVLHTNSSTEAENYKASHPSPPWTVECTVISTVTSMNDACATALRIAEGQLGRIGRSIGATACPTNCTTAAGESQACKQKPRDKPLVPDEKRDASAGTCKVTLTIDCECPTASSH